MIKVLEIINLYENAVNFIGDQFSYLREYGGYEMHLICSSPIAEGKGISVEDFCKKHQIKCKIVPLPRELSLAQDWRSIRCVTKYLKENKIDIIIAHQTKAIMVGMIAGFLAKTPIRIIVAHGILTETMTGLKQKLIDAENRMMVGLSTNVICVSKYVKDVYDQITSKAVLLGHGSCTGIDTVNHFNPQNLDTEEQKHLETDLKIMPEDFVIGFSGRLVRDKGVVELVEAFNELKNRNDKHYKLLVVGPHEVRDTLPEDVKNTLDTDPNIIYTGYVDYAKIQKYYSLMDVCVLPSHREGLGLAPLEAQAMCTPAITTDHTGCRETLIQHKTGCYCKMSKQSIIDAITWIGTKERATELGKAGREFVRSSFESAVVHQNILEYINSLVHGK